MISIFIRTTIMFFLVMFTMRLMGKKSLGEFQPSDLVSVMLISNLTSTVIEAPELPILFSVVPILLITCYEIFISVAARKSPVVARLSQGKSMVIIKDGIIDQKVMNNLRFTVNDILDGMRSKDIFYLEEVKLAMVETTGSMSIYPDPNAATNIQKADIPPFSVIEDGKFNIQNMETVGVDNEKLDKILIKENISAKNILLMMIDGNHRYNNTLKEYI